MSEDDVTRARNVIAGQEVSRSKMELAKNLRRRMTAEERLLWQHLRANRLHGLHFRRQQVIDGFVVDFYCHAAGLVLEVDGEAHARRAGYDRERDRALSARGLCILRIKNEDVRGDLSGLLATIAAHVEATRRA